MASTREPPARAALGLLGKVVGGALLLALGWLGGHLAGWLGFALAEGRLGIAQRAGLALAAALALAAPYLGYRFIATTLRSLRTRPRKLPRG